MILLAKTSSSSLPATTGGPRVSSKALVRPLPSAPLAPAPLNPQGPRVRRRPAPSPPEALPEALYDVSEAIVPEFTLAIRWFFGAVFLYSLFQALFHGGRAKSMKKRLDKKARDALEAKKRLERLGLTARPESPRGRTTVTGPPKNEH